MDSSNVMEWLLKLAAEAASRDLPEGSLPQEYKTINMRIGDDKADIFISASPRPDTPPNYQIERDEAFGILTHVLALSALTAAEHERYNASGTVLTSIPRARVGICGFHIGITRLHPTLTIASITATLTDEEVEQITQLCAEAPHTVDDLLREAEEKGYMSADISQLAAMD